MTNSKSGASPAASLSYGALLRNNRDFRQLFWARLISLFGDWFNTLAILALLRDLGGLSAGSFAWILIFKTLPSLFVTPVAGVCADRFSRRTILLLTNVGRFFVVLGMLSLYVFPSVTALYVLVVAQAAMAAFFDPARSALVPDVVADHELTAANAIDAASWSAMLTLGAAMGGLTTATLGWTTALVIDALSYVVSGVFLWRLKEPEWTPTARAPGGGWLRTLGVEDVLEGFRYVLGRPRVWSLMLVKPGWCLAGSITLVLTVLGETEFMVFGNAMIGVAILYTARGFGTGTGPILARWWSRSAPHSMERAILYGYLCGACFYLVMPFVGSIAVAALLVFGAHLGGATVWVFSTVRLQQQVPTQVRGRVFAAEQGLFTSVMAASTYMFGWMLDSGTVEIRGAFALLSCLLGLAAVLWSLRGYALGFGDSESSSADLEPQKVN